PGYRARRRRTPDYPGRGPARHGPAGTSGKRGCHARPAGDRSPEGSPRAGTARGVLRGRQCAPRRGPVPAPPRPGQRPRRPAGERSARHVPPRALSRAAPPPPAGGGAPPAATAPARSVTTLSALLIPTALETILSKTSF